MDTSENQTTEGGCSVNANNITCINSVEQSIGNSIEFSSNPEELTLRSAQLRIKSQSLTKELNTHFQ